METGKGQQGLRELALLESNGKGGVRRAVFLIKKEEEEEEERREVAVEAVE